MLNRHELNDYLAWVFPSVWSKTRGLMAATLTLGREKCLWGISWFRNTIESTPGKHVKQWCDNSGPYLRKWLKTWIVIYFGIKMTCILGLWYVHKHIFKSSSNVNWLVNTGSGNGLAPSGNKPFSEPVLTQIYVFIWRHYVTRSH